MQLAGRLALQSTVQPWETETARGPLCAAGLHEAEPPALRAQLDIIPRGDASPHPKPGAAPREDSTGQLGCAHTPTAGGQQDGLQNSPHSHQEDRDVR